jgi:5-methylcytosine-specific restriction endonuclease McrA
MKTSKKRTAKRVGKRTTRPKVKKSRYKHDRPEYLTKEYQTFVRLVRERDQTRCQFPGCRRYKFGINVHHILPWSKFPTMRYEPSNGVCLCEKCHKLVTGNEMAYVGLFLMIARENAIKYEKRLRSRYNA